ncbi:MAG: aminopeptidase, partial [Bacilli bacterium]
KAAKLNELRLVSLHYTSKNGTDLKVGLIPEAKFLAGGEKALGSGIPFNPNMPTEECFTTPRKGEAEGKVFATMPLSYQGEVIDGFWFEFKDGKVVDFGAKQNEPLLKQMLDMDENARYMGEVALVPKESPINEMGILFYSTLFDENASCHIALGMGYSNTIRNYENYTLEELREMGVNSSMIHVDFMIGTDDMHIVGTTQDGREVTIFKDGTWAI